MTEARHARDLGTPLRARKHGEPAHAASVASRLFSEVHEQTSLETSPRRPRCGGFAAAIGARSAWRSPITSNCSRRFALLADESLTVIGRWRAFIAEQAGPLLLHSAYHAERKLIVSFPVLLRLLSRIQPISRRS